MSRVKKPNKYLNLPKHSSEELQTGKMVHIFGDKADYRRVHTLRDWLSLKYNMSYETFKGKEKSRKDILRKEYAEDTHDFQEQSRLRQREAEERFYKEKYGL